MPPRRIPPLPGQESVWDYPRPPRLEPTSRRIRIIFSGTLIVDSVAAQRVLETSHPPVYYIPPADIAPGALVPAEGSSWCEWKGRAAYWSLDVGGRRAERVAWSYPEPAPGFGPIAGYVAFYAGPMDACLVDDEKALPQPGDFYGGWITADVAGPFKGGPGSQGW
ncbi:MAG TPA: DUF427 domain-containing protein [Herpetosiphonaceae bacterium]|nr:DUF427 domain-containing protein [Herpetosiphonaceae bacterium]